MDLAVLSCLVGRQPLLLRGPETVVSDLETTCSFFNLQSEVIAFSDTEPIRPPNRDTNVVIATNIHGRSRNTQCLAFDILGAAQAEHFLFIAVIPGHAKGPPFLTGHLNDTFFFMYTHGPEGSFQPPDPLTPYDITTLRKKTALVRSSAELRRYTHDIVTFLRLNRAVAGGVSAVASRQLSLLSRVLAVLNGLDYTTPSVIAMAARKVFLHRIEITSPENERSMQWGSSLRAVAQALSGQTPEKVVEEVLDTVPCPL